MGHLGGCGPVLGFVVLKRGWGKKQKNTAGREWERKCKGGKGEKKSTGEKRVGVSEHQPRNKFDDQNMKSRRQIISQWLPNW